MILSQLTNLTLLNVNEIYPLPLQSVQPLVYLFTPQRRSAPLLAWSPLALNLILSTSSPICRMINWLPSSISYTAGLPIAGVPNDNSSLLLAIRPCCQGSLAGRAFIHRIINLLHNFRRDDHPIPLSAEFKKNLTWWLQYLASWNGVCFWVTWACLLLLIWRCPVMPLGP